MLPAGGAVWLGDVGEAFGPFPPAPADGSPPVTAPEDVRRRVRGLAEVGVGTEVLGSSSSSPSPSSSLVPIDRPPGTLLREEELPLFIRLMGCPVPTAGSCPCGAFKQAWIRFFPSGCVTSGWSLAVV